MRHAAVICYDAGMNKSARHRGIAALFVFLTAFFPACAFLSTWSADRDLKAGNCQDAVEEYDYQFEKKPELKNNPKVMLRYRRAERCAADQAIDKAMEKLESGHPTAAYFALQKSLRFVDPNERYKEAAEKIETERNKILAMARDAAEAAVKGSFDDAAAKIREALKRDPELASDETRGLRGLHLAAKGFINGATHELEKGRYLQAESALLISRELIPDYQYTNEILADVYEKFARHHLSEDKPGHALLVLVRAGKNLEGSGLSNLKSEVFTALADEMKQNCVVKAENKAGNPYIGMIDKRLESQAKDLFAAHRSGKMNPLWTFVVNDVRQQADYFEKPENLTKKYRSGYKSVQNPEYDYAADRLSNARRDELRLEKRLSRLADQQSREMSSAERDRRQIAGNMPKDPDKQDSWRRRLSNAEDKIDRLRSEHNRERRNLDDDLDRCRRNIIDRERELHRTPRTKQEPVYSYWSYQRVHKTREVSTILYLTLLSPKPASESYAGEVHSAWRSTDYTIIGHNRRLGIEPKKARVDSMQSVRQNSEVNAAKKAASWFLLSAGNILAKSYEEKWRSAAGGEKIEFYVKYAVLTKPNKRAVADLPYNVDPEEIPTLP